MSKGKTKSVKYGFGHGEHFDFLISKEIIEAEIDLTSAKPIKKVSPYVSELLKPENTTFLFSENVENGGQTSLKKNIFNYFDKNKIICTEKNLIIDDSIFLIISRLCDLLKLAEQKQTVLIATPSTGFYALQCKEMGIGHDFIKTTKEQNWEIDPKQLDKKLSENPNIKILILNYPNNPTGAVMIEKHARTISSVIKKYPDLIVVSDEIFKELILEEDKKSFSLGSIPEISDQVITMSGVGKPYGLEGVRTSFARFPEQIAFDYNKTIQHQYSQFNQEFAARALEENDINIQYLKENREKYLNKINLIKEQIASLNQTLKEHFGDTNEVYVKPYIENVEAGNVYLLDFSGLKNKIFENGERLQTGLDVAKFILEKTNVAVVPGECSFLEPEEMAIRINLAHKDEETKLVFERLGNAIKQELTNPPKTTFIETEAEKAEKSKESQQIQAN